MTAQELKEYRKASKKTLAELADYLGVTVSAVRKWEADTNPIPPAVEKLLKSPNRLEFDMETLEEIHKHAIEKGCSFTDAVYDLIKIGIKSISLLIFAAILATVFLSSPQNGESLSPEWSEWAEPSEYEAIAPDDPTDIFWGE